MNTIDEDISPWYSQPQSLAPERGGESVPTRCKNPLRARVTTERVGIRLPQYNGPLIQSEACNKPVLLPLPPKPKPRPTIRLIIAAPQQQKPHSVVLPRLRNRKQNAQDFEYFMRRLENAWESQSRKPFSLQKRSNKGLMGILNY